MPIRSDRSALPRDTEGNPPDSEPRFVTALAAAFEADYLAQGLDERATANGSLLRGSDAGQCARALSYEIRRRRGDEGMDRTNPFTLADYWRMGLGTIIHDRLAAPLKAAFPDAQVEVVAVYDTPDLSLHADFLVEHEGKRVLCELKTVGGFQYKMMIGGGGKRAEGPRLSAILQGALAAHALHCDEMVVGLLALELLSPAEAKKRGATDVGRFAAEFTFDKPSFTAMAEAELARLAQVQDTTAAGGTVKRVAPGLPLGAEIVDPASGRWELRDPAGEMILDSGTHALCNYCSHQDRCAADREAGR